MMKASTAWKNKFCLQVLPTKSSVSLHLERKSLSIGPEHILQSAQLNVSAPLIFYALGISFYIYIIISIILSSPVLPHLHHFPLQIKHGQMNPIEQNERTGEGVGNIQITAYKNAQKKSQRTNKCKGTMCFRKSQGYMSLQARRVFRGHIAQCFPRSHPTSLR